MLITTALFASVVVAGLGAIIAWSNPSQWLNRVAFTCSLHLSAWLMCLHLAISLHEGLFWLRAASAVGAGVPMHFWLIKESIANKSFDWWRRSRGEFAIWGGLTGVLAIMPLTDVFIPSHSTAAVRVFGWGYYAYIALNLGLYVALLIDTFRTARRLSGGRRLGLQVWLAGGCGMTTLIFTLMALNALTHDRVFIRLQPLVVLVFYGGTVIAITTYRIFDARQLVLVVLEKSILVFVVVGFALGLDWLLASFCPAPFDLFATAALSLWFADSVNNVLNRWFRFYPSAVTARQAAFAIARQETRIEKLEKAFVDILKGWGQTESALLLSGNKEAVRGGGLEIAEDCDALRALHQLRWATPERLARERSSVERRALEKFLTDHGLGVIVIAHGPTLTTVIGVGVAASRRPFTYPQVTQLIELSAIIESALERAHFSIKAQHAEQLATVGLLGASFAHEIRNPLVTIKTFVQLLPKHHDDPAFRKKFFGLISEEVTRIDRLTEQLLDLASPRVYNPEEIDLHPVLRSSVELVAAKAADKRIEVRTDFQASPDRAFTDRSAAKQVVLNLCFNAIQAIEKQEGERWVKVSTRSVNRGIEMIVEDSGPGIAPEIRPRLFQPFQTTKSSGFGLGLAICSDILAGLDSKISVDPPTPGRGACFRVIFPCPA